VRALIGFDSCEFGRDGIAGMIMVRTSGSFQAQ